MRKRMLVMLAVVVAFLAIIGSVKYFQIRSAMAQQGGVSAAAGGGDDGRGEAGDVGHDHQRHRHGRRGERRDRQRRSAGRRRADLVRLRPARESRATCWCASIRNRSARSSPRRRRSSSSRGVELERDAGLVASGDRRRSRMSIRSRREYKQAEARVGEIRATIERKTIRAPFSGVLGIRQVNLGQYLAGGAPIVSLQALQPVYVHFTVPQQEVARLRPARRGARDLGRLRGNRGRQGRPRSIRVVDEATRNMRVQAVFDNRDPAAAPGHVRARRSSRAARRRR